MRLWFVCRVVWCQTPWSSRDHYLHGLCTILMTVFWRLFPCFMGSVNLEGSVGRLPQWHVSMCLYGWLWSTFVLAAKDICLFLWLLLLLFNFICLGCSHNCYSLFIFFLSRVISFGRFWQIWKWVDHCSFLWIVSTWVFFLPTGFNFSNFTLHNCVLLDCIFCVGYVGAKDFGPNIKITVAGFL